MSRVREFLARFQRSTEVETLEEEPKLTHDRISEVSDRQMVTVKGTIGRFEVRTSSKSRWLEAVLDDGSGDVTLVWMGRDGIPGVVTGRRLRARGRISDKDGLRRIFNPDYTLL